MAHLRHAAVERHMGVYADPTIGTVGKHQGCAAGARKLIAIWMIARAGPRCDHGRHHPIGRYQNRGLLKDEMESLGPVKIKEVESAQQQIIATVRQLEVEGLVSLKGSVSEQYVV